MNETYSTLFLKGGSRDLSGTCKTGVEKADGSLFPYPLRSNFLGGVGNFRISRDWDSRIVSNPKIVTEMGSGVDEGQEPIRAKEKVHSPTPSICNSISQPRSEI